MTEAVRRVLGDRVIGICDAPQALCRRVAAALDRDPDDLWFDYFGINHLGWLRGVLDHGRRPAPGPPRRRRAPPVASRRAGSSAPTWLRSIGMIPNEYLYYYDFATEALTGMQAGRVRAEFLQRQQDAFYAGVGSPAEALRVVGGQPRPSARGATWRRPGAVATTSSATSRRLARPAATAGCRSISSTRSTASGTEVLILNVANRSSLPFLDEEAVVEVPCVVGRGGIVPVAIGSVPMAAAGADRGRPGGGAGGDRGGALAVAQPGRPGARPPPAGALRRGRRPDPRPPSRRAAAASPRRSDDGRRRVRRRAVPRPRVPRPRPDPGGRRGGPRAGPRDRARGDGQRRLRPAPLGLDAVVCAPIGTRCGRTIPQGADG